MSLSWAKNEDKEKYGPFHISVAATAIHDGDERVWYTRDEAPKADEYGELADCIEGAADKLFQLYVRLYARLAYFAELVEKAMVRR